MDGRSKHDRISDYVEGLSIEQTRGLDPCYLGYFQCFNRGEYYEAHDVLEHLWLSTTGREYDYYKGLIQAAGAYVHLRKQYLRPEHPTDGRRLHPAVRLFALAIANLEPFQPNHQFFDVAGFIAHCSDTAQNIKDSNYRKNPWNPRQLPQLHLDFQK